MVFSSVAPFLDSASITAIPRHTAASLITTYQKYLSPIKGFSCAHRVLHGGESCSQYVKRTILERGLSDAWPDSRQRFRDCRSAYLTIVAHRMMASNSEEPEYEGAAEPKKKKENTRACPSSSSPTSSDCCTPDLADGCYCLSNLAEGGACDAGGCDVGAIDLGACDAGACDVGACDVGGCDVGSC